MFVAICDDSLEELSSLEKLLKQWQEIHPAAMQYRSFRNAVEMLDSAERERYSLYLLDVMMPGMDGIAAAKEIRGFDEVADIVFLTSSPGFAYESYRVKALDYLLKPVSTQLVFPLLDRIFFQSQLPEECLSVKIGHTLTRIPFSQICFVEVNGKRLFFHLSDGSIRETLGSLNNYDSLLLAQPGFFQAHRSYIINLSFVSELSASEIKTFSGDFIPVSRQRSSELQKSYMEFMFSEVS